jgi:hypothetical protein
LYEGIFALRAYPKVAKRWSKDAAGFVAGERAEVYRYMSGSEVGASGDSSWER